ncbi:MAG: isocitrate/isopropylmalate family dehydrogenase [Pseudomonadales bacterium]
MTKTVAVIKGEDAAPEAMDATLEVLQHMHLDLAWVFPVVGKPAKEQHGTVFPDAAKAMIDSADATLFGATSGPCTKALFYLRWGKQTYANLRPTRYLTGFQSPLAAPEKIDFVIVRENLEDMYLFLEGPLEDLAPLNLTSRTNQQRPQDLGPGNYAIKAITEAGSERIIRHAFALANERAIEQGRPGRVTVSAKTNMLPQTDGLFAAVGARIAQEFPDIHYESFIVDDMAHRLVAQADHFDVIVMPNLYGDILSDAAAGLAGGLGLAPSACIGNNYAYFEPAHGTAPDIAGQGIINPTATLLSAAMMLSYLGDPGNAQRLNNAIAALYAERRVLTPDQGGNASTQAFAQHLCTFL